MNRCFLFPSVMAFAVCVTVCIAQNWAGWQGAYTFTNFQDETFKWNLAEKAGLNYVSWDRNGDDMYKRRNFLYVRIFLY